MANGDSYSWIGGTAGTWGDAANWEDLTTGTVAEVAPGISNDVTIGGAVTLDGTGSAATLSILNADSIIGGLNVGTLQVAADGGLNIVADATVDAVTVVDAGTVVVDGPSADLLITGTLNLDQTELWVINSGFDQAGGVALNSLTAFGPGYPFGQSGFYPSDSSTIEIGNAGTALAGVLTIDPGQSVSGSGFLFRSYNGSTPDLGTGADLTNWGIVNNGLVGSSELQIGTVLRIAGQAYESPQHVVIDYINYDLAGTLTGTGWVEV
jgi:hypothetical protein